MNLTRFVKAPKNKKNSPWQVKKYYNGIIALVNFYNLLVGWRNKKQLAKSSTPSDTERVLGEVRRHALKPSDISDHLETIFLESVAAQPSLIVELGVGPGESTFVFERVAKNCGAKLVSVDLRKEMGKACSWPDWFFVNENDVEFAKKFPQWAAKCGITPSIDILFIDTSHKYEHTLSEIEHWFPFLSAKAKVFFHDTNVRPIYCRRDGTIGLAYDIQRGVIRALETYLGKTFNEKKDFVDSRSGWSIKHYASCNGLTILTRTK